MSGAIQRLAAVPDNGTATAIVLAGRREGALDPLAAAAGVKLKCQVPVAGRPLLGHVVAALAASDRIREIRVVIDDAGVLEGIDACKPLAREGRMVTVPARHNLADSILVAAEGATFPLYITTADNVLLTPEAVDQFIAAAHSGQAGAALAFARRDAVLAAHPEGQRCFYRFADDSYSNCNTYWLGESRALAAVETFRSGGQFAKYPARILEAFGLANLIRFKFGIGTLAGNFARFSKRFGFSILPVVLDDGALAIDVDNGRTHAIAEQLLLRRNHLAAAA